MRRCVWSRNLKNEEVIARVGPQRHRGKKITYFERDLIKICHIAKNDF